MTFKIILPGIGITIITGLAALFLSEHYGAPVMLFALLLGIALSFLYEEGSCREGIEFSANFILKLGIALLGLRIALSDLIALGWETIVLLTVAIASTILIGTYTAKVLGLKKSLGVLTGGAVSICGASAALAISAVLPEHKDKERDTLLTVICVTSMSTISMVIYPILTAYFGLDNHDSGLFLGGTIHDVAQVVGAGYSVSDETGNIATLVKLVRVSLLVPVVFCVLFFISWQNNKVESKHSKQKFSAAGVPLFLIVFFLLMLVNSSTTIPQELTDITTSFSRFALIIAITAIGMKSNLAKLTSVGLKPIFLMLIETSWLAFFILLVIFII